MTKENAKKVADDVFKRYPNEKEIFVTSDGQAFFNEVHAKNHSLKNRTGKKLEIFFFQKEDAKTDNAGGADKITAKGLIAQIAAATDAEQVTAILETENAGEKRKSVIDAAEKKIVELSKKD
jgi:hypothetical protein